VSEEEAPWWRENYCIQMDLRIRKRLPTTYLRSRAMGRASGREGQGPDLTTGDLTTDIGGLVPRRMRTVAIVTGVLGLNLSSSQ